MISATPWTARYTAQQNGQGGECRWDIITEDGDKEQHIAKLPGWTDRDADNAKLLAAAPELLEALRAIRLVGQQQRGDFAAPPSEDTLNMDDAIDIASAAIEKAAK